MRGKAGTGFTVILAVLALALVASNWDKIAGAVDHGSPPANCPAAFPPAQAGAARTELAHLTLVDAEDTGNHYTRDAWLPSWKSLGHGRTTRTAVLDRYHLTIDRDEHSALVAMLNSCEG